jgi:hypothetical protein
VDGEAVVRAFNIQSAQAAVRGAKRIRVCPDLAVDGESVVRAFKK